MCKLIEKLINKKGESGDLEFYDMLLSGREKGLYNYLINILLGILDTANVDEEDVGDISIKTQDNIMSLFRLLKICYNTSYGIYLAGGNILSNLMAYTKQRHYFVYASNGKRQATINEITNGVEQLEVCETPVITEDYEQKLHLLLWTFYGKLADYRKAGFDYHFKNNKLVETPLELITKSANKLKELYDWLNNSRESYDSAIYTLKENKKFCRKNGTIEGYKYSNYAEDEIEVMEPAKHIVYMCEQALNERGRLGLSETLKTASSIIFRINNLKYKPTYMDYALLRKAYSEIKATKGAVDAEKDKIKELINKLKQGSLDGYINKNDFAFKIIGTVEQYGKCTDKQLNILKDEEKILDEAIKKVNSKVEKKLKTEENIENSIYNEIEDIFSTFADD